MELPNDEVICFRAGTPAFRLKSIPYFNDPLYTGLFRPDPLYPVPSSPPRLSPSVSLGSVIPAVAAWGKPVVQSWAKQPVRVAIAAALLLATITVTHVYAERADNEALATRADLEARLLDEDRQRLNVGRAQSSQFEADRQDIIAWRDKVQKFVMQDNVMRGEICRR